MKTGRRQVPAYQPPSLAAATLHREQFQDTMPPKPGLAIAHRSGGSLPRRQHGM